MLDSILKPYQREAVEWLKKNRRGVLGFSPGCGKSLTALVAVKELESKLTLIVCPASVISVWVDECKKWFDEVPTVVRAGKTARHSMWWAMYPPARPHGIVICGYETVRTDIDYIKKIDFEAIILDETLKIQSPVAKVTKAVTSLKAQMRIALNGTLLSNGYADIWSTFNWIAPGCLYGSFWSFKARHAVLNPYFHAVVGWRDTAVIKEKTDPYVLRRNKEELAKQLPPITEQTISVELNSHEKEEYRIIQKELRARILGEDVPISNALVELLRLRQVTNGLFAFGRLDVPSSKTEAVIELLEMIGPDKKVLIFSGFRQTIDYLQGIFGERAMSFHGGMTTDERMKVIADWRADKKCQLLIGTDAMGVGLNLQDASYIINCDQNWSYAKYQQRIGRSWRMGQTLPVTVYNLVATGTVDEHVQDILNRKTQSADEFAGVTRADIDAILSE